MRLSYRLFTFCASFIFQTRPKEYLKELQEEQFAHRFKVTGVLLDKGSPGMNFSLKAFCQSIYRTSELLEDDIVRGLVSKRV